MMGSDGNRDERAIGSARERMADVLKAALEPVEDAPIDDATRRLMLHLSIEPLGGVSAGPAKHLEPEDGATSASLLRRIFGYRRWKSGQTRRSANPDRE
ncbi:hypothetical protein [Sphingomonas sp. S2-65]|uniref:hypothetical protein n=1 Tax=Sphingomonas sp. S2-65 TaxID=2903960 RepID=UPI001F3C47BC|nr:hypothetical protein [Sphingomonas sp. S2-65]UYY58775.1 hypothetical protein LZ586_01305 [Sphingomonas sp. S2-65]